MNNRERFLDFLKLKNNWNEHGANKFSKDLIDKCILLDKYIIFNYEVFPTACNSIQFEFEKDNKYLEIEVFNNKFEIFIKDNNERNYEFENDIFGIVKVINIIKYFHLNNNINNISVFTGAFNPPTKAHNHVIKRVLNLDDMDLMVIALSNKNFLERKQKRLKDIAFSEEDRLLMMLSMTYKNPNILLYGIEDGYTYDILSNVKKFFTKSNIFFIAGSDKINQIPRWGHGDKFLKEFGFIILTRNDEIKDIDDKCKDTFKFYKILDTSAYENLSATKVRKAIKDNIFYENMVSEEVFNVLENIKSNYY